MIGERFIESLARLSFLTRSVPTVNYMDNLVLHLGIKCGIILSDVRVTLTSKDEGEV